MSDDESRGLLADIAAMHAREDAAMQRAVAHVIGHLRATLKPSRHMDLHGPEWEELATAAIRAVRSADQHEKDRDA